MCSLVTSDDKACKREQTYGIAVTSDGATKAIGSRRVKRLAMLKLRFEIIPVNYTQNKEMKNGKSE